MDLMTLAAKITLDDSSFKSGIQNAESMGERLSGKLSAVTVAAGQLMADVVRKGVSAIQGVVNGAVEGYANYQQLIGGVETLFKGSADKVANYAKQSYKTTGLSANDYMETVTSFSASLLQGLKGDTDTAADLANTAIQDMADNANKMGTDMSAIQTAYQGFAKQNYTMLDNLKLGYGGTKEEMVRLVNDSGILQTKIDSLDGITFDQLIEAIHKIQEQLGITGTTASEAADTISGSKASLKAAWEDLLSAVGGEGDQARLDQALSNFKESFSTYMDNFIPTLVKTIANSGSLVTAIGEAIGDLPTDLLSNVAEAGLHAGTGVVTGVSKITHWLIESITNMFKSATVDPSQIAEFGTALGEFLGTAISDIVTNAPAIVEGIFTVGVTLAGSLVEGLFSGLFGTGNEVDDITDQLSEDLTDINFQTTKAGAILDYMDSLVEKYGQAAKDTEEWKSAQSELETILGGSGEVFEQYGDDIQGAVDKLKAMNDQLRQTAITNALIKASEGQYELLAEQTLRKNQAAASVERNEFIMDSTRAEIIDAIMANARGKVAEFDENGGPVGAGQTDYYNKLVSLSEGLSHVGDRMTELSDLDFTELKDALNFLSDTTFTDEEYEGKKKAYEEAKANAESAKAEMEAAEEEIKATKDSIADLNAAMTQTTQDLFQSSSEVGTGITSGGSVIQAALVNVAAQISAFKISTGGWFSGLFMPRAVGIDEVPFDGFRTELHKGEAVLTKEENAARRSSSMSSDAMEQALEDAIERSMSRMYINMSGQKVADITTKRTGRNISANEHSRVRAMGG